MNPKFSIIIPVYNVAPYLRECLDSVLSQTFTDWEAICVDDGSTDGSSAILDEYAAKDSRFRVVHQANAGVSAARNAALDIATGEWIGFLDADDFVAEDWLGAVAKVANAGVDWVRTGWTDSGVKGLIPSSSKKHLPDGLHRESRFEGHETVRIGWRLVSRCSFPVINFYKCDSVKNIRFPIGVRFREDAIFGFRAAAASGKLAFAETAAYVRREREGSATFSCRRRDDTMRLLRSFLAFWEKGLVSGSVEVDSSMIESVTHWVRRDVCEWFMFCRDDTPDDRRRLWRLVKDLRSRGALSRRTGGSIFDVVRWNAYLATGCGRILLVNRKNIFGRRRGWVM